MVNIKKIAELLGSRGGQKTLALHGREHFVEAGRKGREQRNKNREKKSGDNQPLAKNK